MSEKLPDQPIEEGASPEDGGARTLNIASLHLHANDIDALRRMADSDPELARLVVSQRESFDRREHASMRFGIIMACMIVAFIIGGLTYGLVHLGIILSTVFIFVVIALALFVRVLMTGKWSDTSWTGHLVQVIVAWLGGKPKGADED